MPAQEPLPGLVAERLGEVRRADDVGEHERLARRRGPAPPILGVAQLALGGLDVDPGPEAAELVERRLQLEVGVVVVVEGAKRARQDAPARGRPRTARRPRASRLIAGAQLARPPPPRRPRPGAPGPARPVGRPRAPATGSPRRSSSSSSTAVRARPTSPAAIAISTWAGRSRARAQRSQVSSATAALIAAAAALILPSASRIRASAGCGDRPRACASRSAASAPSKSPCSRRMSPIA